MQARVKDRAPVTPEVGAQRDPARAVTLSQQLPSLRWAEGREAGLQLAQCSSQKAGDACCRCWAASPSLRIHRHPTSFPAPQHALFAGCHHPCLPQELTRGERPFATSADQHGLPSPAHAACASSPDAELAVRRVEEPCGCPCAIAGPLPSPQSGLASRRVTRRGGLKGWCPWLTHMI